MFNSPIELIRASRNITGAEWVAVDRNGKAFVYFVKPYNKPERYKFMTDHSSGYNTIGIYNLKRSDGSLINWCKTLIKLSDIKVK